jgi:transcriptional regulator with XRE-family HTH domain
MIIITVKDEVKTRLLIAECGYSLRQFGEKIKVSHCYLSQVLSSKRKPSPEVAQKIASGLDLKIKDIFLVEMVGKSTTPKRRSS